MVGTLTEQTLVSRNSCSFVGAEEMTASHSKSTVQNCNECMSWSESTFVIRPGHEGCRLGFCMYIYIYICICVGVRVYFIYDL